MLPAMPAATLRASLSARTIVSAREKPPRRFHGLMAPRRGANAGRAADAGATRPLAGGAGAARGWGWRPSRLSGAFRPTGRGQRPQGRHRLAALGGALDPPGWIARAGDIREHDTPPRVLRCRGHPHDTNGTFEAFE